MYIEYMSTGSRNATKHWDKFDVLWSQKLVASASAA